MPSFLHEALLLLFDRCPELAVRLVRDLLGVPLPPYREAELADGAFSQVVPPARLADRLVVLRAGAPCHAIILEAQLGIDPEKKFAWPLYAAAARAALRVPTCLLVVAPDPFVATWARAPISLQPGCPFAPLVLGPEEIPWIRNPAAARQAPELAVLAALCHGNAAGGLEVVLAALAGTAGLDDERRALYHDLVHGGLGAEALRALEELMANLGVDRPSWYPEWLARKFFSDGEAQGEARGEARGKAEALLAVCAARGLALTDAERARILECADPATLDRWIRGAVGASCPAAIFE